MACRSFFRHNYISLNLYTKSQNRGCSSRVKMNEKPVEESINRKLNSALNPVYLEIRNESYMHNVPKGSETHFKVLVVSEKFKDVPLLGRHQVINNLLGFELRNGVHALSIVAKTPDQWNPDDTINPSPKCLGGFGK